MRARPHVWRTNLGSTPQSAVGNPQFTAVLVGEVWLCSGQSNMEYALGAPKRWAPPATFTDAVLAADVAASADAPIRLFLVEKMLAPPEVVSAGWSKNSGPVRDEFSTVGWVFGRNLQRALGVPVGLITSAWGGSRIEEWTPDDAYAPLEAVFTGEAAISFEKNAAFVGRNYDAMVRPLAPFAVRGVIWYQGESNLLEYHDGVRYADKFRVFVDAWRAAFERRDMPFYAVQIAPYLYSPRKDRLTHTAEALPEFWEGQARACAVPHTGLVPITDLVGDLRDIHPAKKRTVGERLAALALVRTYGRSNVLAGGPEFERLEIRGAEAIVHFRNAAGLTTRDGHAPVCFDIVGADGKWTLAHAKIRGEALALWAPSVKEPAAVRGGWHETAQPNLVNGAGWPVFPFRSNGPIWTPQPAH